VLVAVNLIILLIPLGGVVLLRLYESALIRRTERELTAQAAVLAAAFRLELRRELIKRDVDRSSYGAAVATPRAEGEPLRPRVARLDLTTDTVHDRPAPARPAEIADPAVAAAGAALQGILKEARAITLAGARLVDATGVVVASSGTELGRSLFHRREVAEALTGRDVSLMRERISDEPPPPLDSLSRTTRLRVFVALPVIEADRVWGAVVLSRTPASVAQSLYGIRLHLAGGTALLLMAVVLVAAFTSRRIARPVFELMRRTEAVAAGDPEAARPLEDPGTAEIGQLGDAVARMARVLEERAGYIRAFASHVSHEFKTPLTSIRGTVELLRDHLDGMRPDERARFLANLDADAERLQRLTDRLLELARADVARPSGGRTDIAALLAALTERLRAHGRVVLLEIGDPLPEAAIEPDFAETIMSNLLDNARRHGGAGATVELGARPTPHGVLVTIADDGPGLSQANARRAFEPFFTTARVSGGTGLGLAIVRSLVESHGGRVDLRSRPGRTVFSVRLPAAPKA